MANQIKTNNATPARFSKFLSGKRLVPSSLAKDLQRYTDEYERLQVERHKYTPHEADNYIRAFNDKCISNPTPENIAASANFSADDLRKRYADTVDNIVAAQSKIAGQIAATAAKLRDVVVSIVDAEMARAEADARAAHERYGVAYDPESDGLLLSLARWREIVTNLFDGVKPVRPDQIAELIGDVRSKALFG